MRPSWMIGIGSSFLAAVLCATAWGVNTAVPGTLNYVEGKASLGNKELTSRSVGSAELRRGDSLTTGQGKAEILLIPGVFLRVGDDSSVKMISPSITNTQVAIERGRAMVEVAQIHKDNNLRITEKGTVTQLLKKGLYDFDADHGLVRVFDGKAIIQKDDQTVGVKGGREVDLNASNNGAALKARKFDKKKNEGDLYQWSSLRSKYLAQANVESAPAYAVNGWSGSGWYWDPWFGSYTFIPGGGVFYSPFGWPFYSPGYVYWDPMYYGYSPYYGFAPYYGGFYGPYTGYVVGPPARIGPHLPYRPGTSNVVPHTVGPTARPLPGGGTMHAPRTLGGGAHGGLRGGAVHR